MQHHYKYFCRFEQLLQHLMLLRRSDFHGNSNVHSSAPNGFFDMFIEQLTQPAMTR